jgi:hypothetical protein
MASLGGDAGAPAAADESPVAATKRGAALEITWSGWIVEPAWLAAPADDAASRAEDCVAGEMTFTALLCGTDAATGRDATPARPSSARGAAKPGTAENAALSGVCARAAHVHPNIPITEQYAKSRIDFRMACSRLVASKLPESDPSRVRAAQIA